MNGKIREIIESLRQYGRERVVLGSFVVGALLLVAWSFTARLSLITEAQSQIHSSFHLDREIAMLEAQWSQGLQEQVKKEVKLAEQHLLQDFDHLARWLHQANVTATDLGFQARYQLDGNEIGVPGPKGITMIPVRFEMKRQQPDGAFGSSLEFLRRVTEGQTRVDLREMILSGDGKGVHDFTISLHVWMKASE